MKAILCKEFGPPDSLVLEDIAEPELRAGQVRIGVKACGVNFPDMLVIAGKYQIQPPMPFSPGAELAGEVIEAAADVTDFDYSRLLKPAPYSLSGRNRFHKPSLRALSFRSSMTGGIAQRVFPLSIY